MEDVVGSPLSNLGSDTAFIAKDLFPSKNSIAILHWMINAHQAHINVVYTEC